MPTSKCVVMPATIGQARQMLNLLEEKNLDCEQAQSLITSGYLADLMEAAKQGSLGAGNRDAVRVALGLPKLIPDPVITELLGVVLPALTHSLADRIADGNYDSWNRDITAERFPLTLPAGPRQLVLVHFDRMTPSPQVEQWAKDNGYEAALIDDILTVGAHEKYRGLQRQFPIVALGSSTVLDGDRRVPYLFGSGSGRSLYLGYYGRRWSGNCRFLLRKVSSEPIGEDPRSKATCG